ncbi:MarR family transcriptional regulator [Solirubrobacter phytolaccae]|uniref:MarR family transcriptional regulator n=1 Tax=Solirubrobacter phytolaccae TaxID=1404360 RepID=A0A9X3N5F6_9ACTN|nr:MarR family transcriptional regulator [Solirubrobacter phytolaccae]MDA0178800.1 MarR family transcriptional regulator [Solirubrobacter phytolaccae]
MRTISTTDLAHRLRPVLTRLARRMRQEANGDLTPTQVAALATISRFGPLTPSELASREKIQRPTATRVLALLEERGLVARTADPSDRRSSLVAATPVGLELLDAVRERKDAFLALRLETLSPEDLVILDRAAEILERVLDE